MKQIPLTQGKFAIVDDEDEQWLLEYCWWYTKTGYAEGRKRVGKKGMQHGIVRGGPRVLMHRLILNAGVGEFGDHINMNGLDNRRSNLRIATKSQNMANSGSRGGTSKYKGVHWVRTEKVWRATITVNGATIVGGKFVEECDAAQAYNFLAEEYFGEFARFNVV